MKWFLLIVVLLAIFIYSAMELVIVRYQQRLIYNDIVRVQNAQLKLGEEWSYLLLQRANLTSTKRVEGLNSAGLQSPSADQIIYLSVPKTTEVPGER